MSKAAESVEKLLRQLEEAARADDAPSELGATFRLPPDLQSDRGRMLRVSRAVVDLVDRLEAALAADLRFEHLREAKAPLHEFVARALYDHDYDQAKHFVTTYAREPVERSCFLPVEHLVVDSPTTLAGIDLLPVTDPRVPTPRIGSVAFEAPVGSVALVSVIGTDLERMALRAREVVEHGMRVARVGLRDIDTLNNRQLRFRVSPTFAFSDGSSGWSRRGDAAFDLELGPRLRERLGTPRPVWGLAAAPVTDLEKKADLALRWMERSRFAGEPLSALLYLFFALEALLGDRSEGLKSYSLAFRQLMLSHVASGGFVHPNKSLFLYEDVRSAAVHGAQPPPVDERMVNEFELSVRDTLNQYLSLASELGVGRRTKLIRYLEHHPDVETAVAWIRANAGAGWDAYLGRFGRSREHISNWATWTFIWGQAVQRQADRILGAEFEDAQFDVMLFADALRNVLRGAERVMGNEAAAVQAFQAEVPDVAHVRNIYEHFDAYVEGQGNRQKDGSIGPDDWRPLHTKVSHNSYVVNFGKYTLEVARSSEAAANLVAATLEAADRG